MKPLVCAALLVAATACGSDSPDYAEIAEDALERANLHGVDASYDDGVVHVTGTVPTESQRAEAGTIVSSAIGARAQVANEVTVEGGHDETADDLDGGLETRIENRLEAEPLLRDRNVDVSVVNGVVTLTGSVTSAAEKDRISTMARNEAGVRDVVNSLEVRPNRP